MEKMAHNNHLKTITQITLIAVIYFVTAKLGLSLAYGTAQATTVWPPAGIALAAMVLLGYRCWPGILLGAFLANITTNEPAWMAATIALGNTLEALVGAAWLRRVKFQPSLNRLRDVWLFIGITLVIVLIASFGGVASLALGHKIVSSTVREALRVWYLGDLMGILIITPIILLWPQFRFANPFQKRYRGAVVLYATVLLTQVLTYFRSFQPSEILIPRAYQAFPLVIWAAVRTSPFGTAIATLFISTISILGTIHERGPFTQQPTVEANLISLQSFLFYVAATGMTLAAIVAERNAINKSLEKETSQLSESQAQMEGLILSIGEGLVVVDMNGTIALVNRVFERLTGWSSHQVVGKQLQKILPLETEKRQPILEADRLVSRVLKQGKTIETGLSAHPHYYVRKDGQRFPVAVSVAPIRVGGKIAGAVNVFRDITNEFAVDRAKDEFVALASHQLRTPLSTIRWYTEMLVNGEVGKINAKQRQYLAQIYDGNLRMIELVNALLNASRIELGKLSVEPRPTKLQTFIDTIVTDFRADIQARRLKIKREYAESIPEIPLDPQLMRMVIQNILSNAIKYTRNGGRITITLDWGPTSATAAKKKARPVLITIEDTGLGIPAAQQHLIFTKLFRADNVRKQEATGTGLGLYIAKAIVEQSGGRIWFTSEENKGTKFFFTLPSTGMKQRAGTRGLTMP